MFSVLTPLYVLIGLNYLFLLLGGVTALLLAASFSRTQRAQFPVLRRLDGRQLGLTLATIVFLALGYTAYVFKEVAVIRLSFQAVPGPGTSQVVHATQTGIDLELMEAAAHQANAARESFNTGQAHFAAGRYAEAADHYQRSIAALPTLSAILNRGLSLRYLPDYPGAEAVFRTGLKLASEQHRDRFEAHFSLYLSSVLGIIGKDSEAELLSTKALKIYAQIGDTLGQANAHLNRGSFIVNRGLIAEGVTEWQRALEGFVQAGNRLGQANVTNNLGGADFRRMRIPEAVKAYKSALAIYESIANLAGTASASSNLAAVYATMGALSEALALSQRALACAVRQGNQDMRAQALNVIGGVRDEQGRFDEAIAVELSALQLARGIGASEQEAVAHYYLASAFRGLGRLRDAEHHAVSAIEVSQRMGDPRLLSLR